MATSLNKILTLKPCKKKKKEIEFEPPLDPRVWATGQVARFCHRN